MAIRKLNAQAKRMKACKGKTGSAFKTCAFGDLGAVKRRRSKRSLGEMEDFQVCRLIKKGPRKGETVCKMLSKRGAKVKTGGKKGGTVARVFYTPNPEASARGQALKSHPKARLWQSLMKRAATKCCPSGKGSCPADYRSCMSRTLKSFATGNYATHGEFKRGGVQTSARGRVIGYRKKV